MKITETWEKDRSWLNLCIVCLCEPVWAEPKVVSQADPTCRKTRPAILSFVFLSGHFRLHHISLVRFSLHFVISADTSVWTWRTERTEENWDDGKNINSLKVTSTVSNIMKKFTAHSNGAHLPAVDEREQLMMMVDNQPRSSSKEIQAVLQAQSASAWTLRVKGRRPRRNPQLTQRH